jgi:hypothetical protein
MRSTKRQRDGVQVEEADEGRRSGGGLGAPPVDEDQASSLRARRAGAPDVAPKVDSSELMETSGTVARKSATVVCPLRSMRTRS